MKISGRLKRKTFASGSKSRYDAVYIETDNGKEFVLRRIGHNPRFDPGLIEMLGKYVSAKGAIHDYLFLANEVTEVTE